MLNVFTFGGVMLLIIHETPFRNLRPFINLSFCSSVCWEYNHYLRDCRRVFSKKEKR